MFASILLLALSQAELISRLSSPAVTQAEGFVRVFAECPEDMRREYQLPIAGFASEIVKALYRTRGERMRKFERPPLVISIGSARTNVDEVVAHAVTNNGEVTSRIFLVSPGFANLDRFRLEVTKAFYRTIDGIELSDKDARVALDQTDPRLKVRFEREELALWLAGKGKISDGEALSRMRRVFEPGRVNTFDVMVFASRLFLYPRYYDEKFAGKFDCLSFKDAVKFAKIDPRIRLAAYEKANLLPGYGNGRGERMQNASILYTKFLRELVACEKDEDELFRMLERADAELCLALESAER